MMTGTKMGFWILVMINSHIPYLLVNLKKWEMNFFFNAVLPGQPFQTLLLSSKQYYWPDKVFALITFNYSNLWMKEGMNEVEVFVGFQVW